MAPEFQAGNRITLLQSGSAYFPALLQAIGEARFEIYLETYIYANDSIGHALTEALVTAAARGVAVRVLVDGFGGRNFERDFVPRLMAGGVHCLLYRKEVTPFRLKRHRLRRLHRKMAVVDARVAFVGGINIVDDHNTPPGLSPRFDYAARVEGPLLSRIHQAARSMWERVAWASFHFRPRLPRAETQPCCQVVGHQRAAFLVRDNLRHRNDIALAYLEAIDGAQHEILLANAYFLPGLRFRHALRDAARRGVQVTVLVQGEGASDHPIMVYATQALYGALMKEGIRIVEYRRSFLHAKVAVIDDHWATVGSSNIDPFSLLLAQEGNLVIQDRGFARELKDSLVAAMTLGGETLHPGDLLRLSWFSRLTRWACYGLITALLGLAGYGARHWRDTGVEPEPRP